MAVWIARWLALWVFVPGLLGEPLPDTATALRIASELSGYKISRSPEIHFAPAKVISKWFCSRPGMRAVSDCDISGFHFPGHIFVSTSDSPAQVEATLIHELVHELQEGSRLTRCEMEIEADRIEWTYLQRFHGFKKRIPFDAKWYNCEGRL